MSYYFYKVLHVTAVLAVFAAIGAACLHAMNRTGPDGGQGRGLVNGLHGVALLVALVGGFGLLARLGIATGWPGWVWGKLVIWFIAGALVALPYRRPALAKPLLLSLPLLAFAASWLAITKPF